MSFAKVYSAQTMFLQARIIDIEVDISNGLHNISMVGLPDRATEEAIDRVSTAIKNSGFISPKSQNQKIIISLAPADLKKEGSFFDLGISIAYLIASKLIIVDPEKKIFLGELSLDGKLRRINGIISLTLESKRRGYTDIYVPFENAREAALIEDINVYGVKTLKELAEHFSKDGVKIPIQEKTEVQYSQRDESGDIGEVAGQESAKRALEIAAAGGHNIMMYGPPGTGKTMLAKTFSGILPDLSYDEILEVTAIHSIAGILGDDLITSAPFRAPHHTSSYVSLVGGGGIPKPGEITLAHRGVLFLDEFPEFDKKVIESLRQPLEDRTINISRSRGTGIFPAHFLLIATMNPCPCGNFGIKDRICICSALSVSKYQKKISGPIMDRIDLWTQVSRIDHSKLSEKDSKNEGSKEVKSRVKEARLIQLGRFKKFNIPIRLNSEMRPKNIIRVSLIKDSAINILNVAATKLDISPRSYHKIIKIARTIADLGGSEEVGEAEILEALQYRPKQTI